ncbi:hypothetical protein BH24BAC1_BH24BAC1_27360 [soil metagenome]
MPELLEAALSPANIFPTALLGFVLLYWGAVILGLLDLDFLDIEVETDTGEVDGSAVAWLNSALAFFNLGKVPLMLFMTFLALPFWVISLLANHYLVAWSELLGLVLLLPAFVLSLFVAKVLTQPFVKMFAALEKEHDSKETIIGQMCTVILPASATEMGQATVPTKGSPLLLNVKTTRGATLRKGETALVIDYNEHHKIYLIEPYEILQP